MAVTTPPLENRATELRIKIAGVTAAIASADAALRLDVFGPTARFLDPHAQPDIRLEATWGDPEPRMPGPKVFDSGGVWQLFDDGDQFVFRLSSPKFGPRPYTTAIMRRDFGSGVVYLRPDCFERDRPIYPLDYPLDELLITNWLALGRGVEIHACGVVDRDGAGYLFAGHSGDGKTTMAREWCKERDATVLSDDRIVLRKAGRNIWMYGTPWHGDEPLASRECARLTRGFFLRHAPRHEALPVSGAQAVARLFARSFPPFFSAGGLDFVVSLLADITESVPFFELGYVPEDSIRDFVRVRAGR